SFQITAKRVEKPECRIRRVIKPSLRAIREHVGDQSVTDVVREGSQDVSCLEGTASNERKTFEADHGVASPISEPMVSRDDGADFIAGGVRTRRFFKSAARGDDKLIRRKNQLCCNSVARFRNRFLQETRASLAFQSKRGFRREDFDNVPLLGRADQRRTIMFTKIDPKITRAPQIPLVGV